MASHNTLPYAGEDRCQMLSRLAADDFLPPRELRRPVEASDETPSPPERALQSATDWSPADNPRWQTILQQAARYRRARAWRTFEENWIKPAKNLWWLPLILFGSGFGFFIESSRHPTLPAAPQAAPIPRQPIVFNELEMVRKIKESNRKLKKSFGPGKSPPPNSPVPGEGMAALLGMSKGGLQEIRDDWFAPNPVDDEQP